MLYQEKNVKTLLAAFRKKSDLENIEKAISKKGVRVIGVGDIITLIDSLDQYRVNLIITECKLGGVSALSFVPFIQKRYPGIKIIVVIKHYSPEKEIKLREKNVMHVMQWPPDLEIIKDLVYRGLECVEDKTFFSPNLQVKRGVTPENIIKIRRNNHEEVFSDYWNRSGSCCYAFCITNSGKGSKG